MTWIYAIPTWLFMSAAITGSCAVACGALALTRSRLARNELITHNDVAGPILGAIGVILAVLMSFMTVGVWQEYDAAAQNVQNEASALSDLHHLGDAFPMPERRELHSAVDRYITLVLFDEWPRMVHGGESKAAHDTGYDTERIITHFMPANAQQVALQSRGLELVERMLDARRQRIHDNRTGIPMILWATMLFTGAITVVFSFYFRVDRAGAQYVMVIALTAVVTAIFVLMAELDYPFRGDIAVSPEPFVHVYNTVHGFIVQ